MRITTVKMKDVKFDKALFTPMQTGKKIDRLFSSEGGLMKGTNYAIVGDPGAGKTTVAMDIVADLQAKGQKVLFISGEMNAIDMYGYVKRYPKFGELDILFLGDYIEQNIQKVLEMALKPGYDVVLIDSMAEVCNAVADTAKGFLSVKKAETILLNLLETHNQAENDSKTNTAFLIIQQVTKAGNFAGSNRFKHMMTGMAHMKITEEGRCFFFSKNRRGGDMDALFFSLNAAKHVNWMYTSPMNTLS